MKKIKVLMNSTCGLVFAGAITAPIIVNNVEMVQTTARNYTSITPIYTGAAMDVFQIQNWNDQAAISYNKNVGEEYIGSGSNDAKSVYYGFEQGETYSDSNMLFVKLTGQKILQTNGVDVQITVHDSQDNILNDQAYIESSNMLINDKCKTYYNIDGQNTYVGIQLSGSQDVYDFMTHTEFYSGVQYDKIYLDITLTYHYFDEFNMQKFTKSSVKNICVFGNQNHSHIIK